MMITYEMIKAAAKEVGVTVGDLLALSPANDPYAVGTPRAKRMAHWFRQHVWDAAGYTEGVHLRRAHYWAVSKAIELPQPVTQAVLRDGRVVKVKSAQYMNTIESWQFLCKASMYARYMGLVNLESIIDNKNPDPAVYTEYSEIVDLRVGYRVWVDDLDDPYIDPQMPTPSDLQPYHLEIWCEKSTMDDVLLPIAERYRAVLCTFQGEASLTACKDFVERVLKADKPALVLYISDFDPAGISMPKAVSRKIEWLIDRGGHDNVVDVSVRQVCLTLDQVLEYNLPTTPMKPKEKRASSFAERTGIDGAVELDALEATRPGELNDIVTGVLDEYFSDEAEEWYEETSLTVRRLVLAEVDKINKRFSSMLKEFEKYREAIGQIEVDTSVFDVDENEFHLDVVEYGEDFLYKTGRTYAQQMEVYKIYNHEEVNFTPRLVDEAIEDAYYG